MKSLRQTKTGYIFDKRIFRAALGIMLLVLIFILWKNDFDFSPKFYFKCDKPLCQNPLYKIKYNQYAFGEMKEAKELENCDWCNNEYLTMGEYGEKEPVSVKAFYILCTSLILLSFCLNHLIYNRGKKFDFGIELPKFMDKFKEEGENED